MGSENAKAQTASVVVNGRVVDADGKAIDAVEIEILNPAGQRLANGRSDSKGRFTITARDSLARYLISFRRVGYVWLSKSVERGTSGAALDLGDVVLASRFDVLEPVVTKVAKLVPAPGAPRDIGSADPSASRNRSYVADPSDLAALLSLLPGVGAAGDSGVSVLGAPPGQNRLVVDGADFLGGHLPRDAIQNVRLRVNPFDPAAGGFSGAEASVTTRRGTPRFDGTVRGEAEHPSLAWADPRSLSPVPTRGTISGFVSGPLVGPDLTVFAAADVSLRSAAATSLLSPRGAALERFGLALDTVAAVAQAADDVGAPVRIGDDLRQTRLLQGSALTRVDLRASATTSFTLSLSGDWTHAPRAGVGPLSFPSTATASDSRVERAQLTGGTYLAERVRDEFSLSATTSGYDNRPVGQFSAGTIQVGSSFADGRTGLTRVRLGGTGSGPSRLRTKLFSAGNKASWVTAEARHQFQLSQELVVERQRTESASELFGSYDFSSVDELDANHPQSFRRAMASSSARVGRETISASMGDIWTAISGRLTLQGGLRLDATRFTNAPSYNAVADSVFGLRTDRVSADIGLSPRLGFQWQLGPEIRRGLIPPGTTLLGSTSSRGSRAPADAGGIAVAADPDNVTISGGVGAFRGPIRLSDITPLLDATGLPSSTRFLECVGDATPVPDWSGDPGRIPTQCAPGSMSVYTSDAPRLEVMSPQFRAPVSWRASLMIDGLGIRGWGIVPQATYALGENVAGRIDRNLNSVPEFELSDEGLRPVFAPSSAIDPETGLIGPQGGRRAPNFGPATERVSDRMYRAAQLTVAVAPRKPLRGIGSPYAVYSWTPQSALQRGFDGSTAGDPRTAEWTAGSQPANQVIVGVNDANVGWMTFGARVTIASGAGFTPMVAQDINGDGLANDRAFIPDPTRATDPELADPMRALLAAASPNVRRCLNRQAGTVAGSNSCRSGWTARLDLALHAARPGGLGLGNRLTVNARVFNAGTALVRLFHLENRWAGSTQSSAPDRQLLQVVGFDRVASRFRYQVNQRFGQPGANGRSLAPFQLQLGVQWLLGPLAARPALSARDADRSRDGVTQSLLRRFFGADPAERLLEVRDTLRLSPDQIAGVTGVIAATTVARDSILEPVVSFVIERGSAMTAEQLSTQVRAVSPRLNELFQRGLQRALSFLTDEQRLLFSRLPPPD